MNLIYKYKALEVLGLWKLNENLKNKTKMVRMCQVLNLNIKWMIFRPIKNEMHDMVKIPGCSQYPSRVCPISTSSNLFRKKDDHIFSWICSLFYNFSLLSYTPCSHSLPAIKVKQSGDTRASKAEVSSWPWFNWVNLSGHQAARSNLCSLVKDPNFSSGIEEWPLLSFG